MPYYSYKAIDQDGSKVDGVLEVDSIDSLHQRLTQQGLYLIDVKQASTFFAKFTAKFQAKKVKRKDIIEFCNNLSIMLKSGIPLISGLEEITKTTDNRSFRSALSDIKRQTEMGMSFSEALSLKKEIMPDILIRLTKIGEETGRLDKSLSDVAEHLQKMEDLAGAIKRALIYPAFSLVSTLGALIFWLAYVMPKIVGILKEMGVQLPMMTKVLIAVSEFTQAYWYLIVMSPLLTYIMIVILQRYESFRYFLDMSKLKIPIMKLVVHNKILAVFSEQMRIMIVSGVPIIRILEIVSEVLNNLVFKKAIDLALEKVSAGERISDSLSAFPIFPSIMIRMIDIGEASGNLDEQFDFLSKYYIKKLDDISEKIGKMIEPIIIAVIGLMFALIVIGLMFPLYELISKVGK